MEGCQCIVLVIQSLLYVVSVVAVWLLTGVAYLVLFHHSPGAPNKLYLDWCDVWWEFVSSHCLGVVSELSVFHFVLVDLGCCFSVASVAILLILVCVGMPFLSHLVCQDNPLAQWLVQFPMFVCPQVGGSMPYFPCIIKWALLVDLDSGLSAQLFFWIAF